MLLVVYTYTRRILYYVTLIVVHLRPAANNHRRAGMPGKDKTAKSGKGKKALEKEWEAAVASAADGSRMEAKNTVKDEKKSAKTVASKKK